MADMCGKQHPDFAVFNLWCELDEGHTTDHKGFGVEWNKKRYIAEKMALGKRCAACRFFVADIYCSFEPPLHRPGEFKEVLPRVPPFHGCGRWEL